MRRDKTAARILLVFSVVHVAVAAPAVVRQRSSDVTEDVTPTLEKRVKSDDESSVDSFSFPLPPQGSMVPETETKSEDSVGSSEPVSNPSRYSAEPTDFGSDRYYLAPEELDNSDLTPPSSSSSNHHLTTPVSGAPELHNDFPSTSGALQSQDHTSPMSGNPPLPNDPPAGSEDSQSHDSSFRWWKHTNWRPTGETEQGESSSQLELGPPTASKAPQLQDDSPQVPGSPHVPNDPPSKPGTSRPPPVHESFGSEDFDTSWRWVDDLRPIEGAPSSSHSETEGTEGPAAAATTTTTNPEIEALKGKLKAYTAFGTILGFGAGIGSGTMIGSIGSYVFALFCPSPPDI